MWHSVETIRKVLKEYSNGVSIEELTKKYNCSKSTINRWRSKYKINKRKSYVIALYDLEDNLFWLGDNTSELAKFLGVPQKKISSEFVPREMKRRFRYKNKWYTKHKIYN